MDVSQIFPNLFVGSFPGSVRDIERLARNFRVTAVLSLQSDDDLAYLGLDWQRMAAWYGQSGIAVRRVPIWDFDRRDLRKQLPLCVAALDELLRAGHTVYVHCNMGINRSPSAVIAYLCWIQGRDLEQAVDHVMRCRPCDPYVEVIRLAGQDRATRS
jgi:protein-tyrosine phosphatase